MKYCPKCDTNKDEEEFYNNRRSSDGKSFYCKPCQKAKVAAYQKTDKGKAVKAKAQRKFINTEYGRAKKQEWEHNWRKTERGAESTREKALKRYYSDPDYFRLKAKARNHGVPIGILKQVQERDKVCQLCGSDKELEFDHIHPVSYGGIGSLDNLQILCRECNGFKSNNLFLPGGGMLVTNGTHGKLVSNNKTNVRR